MLECIAAVNFDNNKLQYKNTRQQLTHTIIKQLKAGTVPWRQTWCDDEDASFYLLEDEMEEKLFKGDKITLIDNFIENIPVKIEHCGSGPVYEEEIDKIFMPHKELFIPMGGYNASENYYLNLFHEIIHWTGHPERLGRNLCAGFATLDYAREELIAELGAAFLATELGITSYDKKCHANYMDSWLGMLTRNKYFLLSIARESSKAVDYLKKLQPLKSSLVV